MKDTLFLALMILALTPAPAQKGSGPNCSASGGAVNLLAQDYAARVDGLLRDVHANLQKISEGVDAGRLTPEQAQTMKLAATRDTISRLDTMAAVYDARLESQDRVDARNGSVTCGRAGTDKATHARTNGTVSVEELKREAAAALMPAPAAPVAR